MKNLRPYPAYKPTGLAWLPEVPREWEMLHIFQVAHETCCKNVGCKEMNVLSLSFGTIKRKQDIYAGLSPTDFATYQIVEPGNTILRLTDLQNDKRSLRTGAEGIPHAAHFRRGDGTDRLARSIVIMIKFASSKGQGNECDNASARF